MDSRITQVPDNLMGMPPFEQQDDLISGISDAIKEAEQQHIRANAVLINSRFAKMPASAVPFMLRTTTMLGDEVHSVKDTTDWVQLPPMVLGLKMFFTDELPDEYAFAVCEAAVQDEFDLLKAENRRLREKLDAIEDVLGVPKDGDG